MFEDYKDRNDRLGEDMPEWVFWVGVVVMTIAAVIIIGEISGFTSSLFN